MKTYQEGEIKVDILGTKYTVIICTEDSDKRFEEMQCAGFCDYSVKKLYISNYVGAKDHITVEDCRYVIRKAICHEVVHAYFYESGLGEDWEHKPLGQEETVVDWIARQLDKIHATTEFIFKKLVEMDTEV